MKISKELSKDDIFKLADEITIFSKYLDIPESTIMHCIETGKLIESPVRDDDRDASAGFKYNNKGKLRLRDFNGYFWGDCFDAVAYVLQLNVNNSVHFVQILKHIYETVTAKGLVKIQVFNKNLSILKAANQTKKVITIETRPWNIHDRYYWNDFLYKERDVFGYIESKYIYPLEHYWVDRDSQPSPKYYYKGSNPGYAYFLGYDTKGIANYRLYFPYNKKPFPKFITNNSSYQGLNNLGNDLDAICIIKSRKDGISIESFVRDSGLNIGVIAPPSENHIMTKAEYDWISSRVKGKFKDTNLPAILSFYDFDRTGLNGSGQIKRDFGVKRVMFTNGKYNTNVTGNKDFTATIPMYGKLKFYKLINEYINKLEII